MRIDNRFNSSCLYVLDWKNNEITIWITNDGKFIDKINIETLFYINFTKYSLFVASRVSPAKKS